MGSLRGRVSYPAQIVHGQDGQRMRRDDEPVDSRNDVHQLLPGVHRVHMDGSFLGATAGPEILDAVLDGTEGNPLYLEERLASLVETRALTRDDDMWQLREDAPAQLPQVLERLVRSRVDRLSPYAREAIRAAAVIGVEFSLPLLTAVCDSATAQVIEELFHVCSR